MRFNYLLAAAVFGLAAAVAVLAGVQGAFPDTAECLHEGEVERVEVIGSRLVVFEMRDGSEWQSRTAATCPGLARVLLARPAGGRYCENEAIGSTGEAAATCRYGRFEKTGMPGC